MVVLFFSSPFFPCKLHQLPVPVVVKSTSAADDAVVAVFLLLFKAASMPPVHTLSHSRVEPAWRASTVRTPPPPPNTKSLRAPPYGGVFCTPQSLDDEGVVRGVLDNLRAGVGK